MVGPEKQGIILDFKEKKFGDKVPLQDVKDAVNKMQTNQSKL